MAARVSRSWNALRKQCRLKNQAFGRYISSGPSTSSGKQAVDNKAFSQTLLLPKTSFKLRQDVKEAEHMYGKLTGEELYRWQVCGIESQTSSRTKCDTSGRTRKDRYSYYTMALHTPMATCIWVRCLQLLAGS